MKQFVLLTFFVETSINEGDNQHTPFWPESTLVCNSGILVNTVITCHAANISDLQRLSLFLCLS